MEDQNNISLVRSLPEFRRGGWLEVLYHMCLVCAWQFFIQEVRDVGGRVSTKLEDFIENIK